MVEHAQIGPQTAIWEVYGRLRVDRRPLGERPSLG